MFRVIAAMPDESTSVLLVEANLGAGRRSHRPCFRTHQGTRGVFWRVKLAMGEGLSQ
jgi:hypothetical protein